MGGADFVRRQQRISNLSSVGSGHMTTSIGGYGDWAGKGALIVGTAIAIGVVKGKGWTQVHTALAVTAAVLFLISRLD